MDEFLATVGSEFDPSFVKRHVGTDELDDLLEFTFEEEDLSPLVDAGLKPLLRSKLYMAILEERTARANCLAATDISKVKPFQVDNKSFSCSTGTVDSLCEMKDQETLLPEIDDDISSSSKASQASTSQVTLNLSVLTMEKPADDSSSPPLISQAGVSDCGLSDVIDVADFPPLGCAGKRPNVPQAKHTVIATGTDGVLAYRADARESRRTARKEAGDAQAKSRQIQEAAKLRPPQFASPQLVRQPRAKQRARQAANLVSRVPVAQLRPPQSVSPQLVPRAQTQNSRLATTTVGFGRQFGADVSMSSACQTSNVPGQPLPAVKRRWQTVLAGKWSFFDDAAQIEFERAHAAGQKIHKFKARGWSYDLDLNRMVQVNLSTTRERAVRRLGDADLDG